MWAVVLRGSAEGRAQALYSARASADSLWKVGRKRGWWKGVRGGDVLLFAASLAVVGAVYERERAAVEGGMVRRGLRVMRGENWAEEREVLEEKKEV